MAVGFGIQHPWVFVFGILGNLVSIFVYFAPLPTFRRICREKSTMGFQCVPYVVALFSAMLWMYYALLKTAVLLISINSLGCIIETIYILLYIAYASKEARKQTMKLVSILIVGGFCGILVVTRFALKDNSARINVVGWICVSFSVSVFAAPLCIVFEVVRTRSAEFMPFALSLALTLSAIMWFCYGLLTKDICVAVPNTVGFFLGLVQMLLYAAFGNQKRPLLQVDTGTNITIDHDVEMVEKAGFMAAAAEQQVINIVMLGHCDQVQVHPAPDPAAATHSCYVSSDHVDDVDDHLVIQNAPPPHNNNNSNNNNNNDVGVLVLGAEDDDDPRPCSSIPPAAQVTFVHLHHSTAIVACPA